MLLMGLSMNIKMKRMWLWTLCLVNEIEDESSYKSYFSSYAKSLHDNEVGSEFKVFTNSLYDEYFDNDQPITCYNS